LCSGQETFAVEVTADGMDITAKHNVAAAAIHDDWYFELKAEDVATFWPALRDGMEACNRRMSPERCQMLILAPSGTLQCAEADASARAIGLPVTSSNADAFGTVLGGLREIALEINGCPQETSLKFLEKTQLSLNATHGTLWSYLRAQAIQGMHRRHGLCWKEPPAGASIMTSPCPHLA